MRAPRVKCPEDVLLHIIEEIRSMRRRDLSNQERSRLAAEDLKEDDELRTLVIEALAYRVSRVLPGGTGGDRPRTELNASKSKIAEEERERQRVQRATHDYHNYHDHPQQ